MWAGLGFFSFLCFMGSETCPFMDLGPFLWTLNRFRPIFLFFFIASPNVLLSWTSILCVVLGPGSTLWFFGPQHLAPRACGLPATHIWVDKTLDFCKDSFLAVSIGFRVPFLLSLGSYFPTLSFGILVFTCYTSFATSHLCMERGS